MGMGKSETGSSYNIHCPFFEHVNYNPKYLYALSSYSYYVVVPTSDGIEDRKIIVGSGNSRTHCEDFQRWGGVLSCVTPRLAAFLADAHWRY